MKTDFFLAKPPYQAKTTGQALQVVFSPFWETPDLVNPKFVRELDPLLVQPVENLVLAVRGLVSRSHKSAQQNLRRIPLFHTVLQLIRDWDVETLNRELILLEREPRGRTFAEAAPLVTELLRPLFRLSRLHPHVHLLPAVAKMYEFGRMYITDPEEQSLLQRYYTIAREEMANVFSLVRPRVYPILLKLLSDRFLDPDQFYLDKEGEILAFLGLTDQDLVRDLPDPAAGPAGARVPGSPAPEPEAPLPSRLAGRGLDLLDQLFPRAGWDALDGGPDLYSYFQTVFEYPKGSDLVAAGDPIQVIQVLSEVLQQFFYGFQGIRWGTPVRGEGLRPQEAVEKAVARWHFFQEEFFGKAYLPLLQEYCREVERAGTLSSDAKRKEHQLQWFRRNYLLPHLSLPIMDDVRVQSLGYPNLAVQVRDMLDLLGPLAAELEDRSSRAPSVLNPEAKAVFPVATLVTARFQQRHRRTAEAAGERKVLDRADLRSLLHDSVAVLTVLDSLLSQPGSLFYTRVPNVLFRTSGPGGDGKPVYSAPKTNSQDLLKKLNALPPASLEVVPWPDRGIGPYGPLLAARDLAAGVHEFHSEKKPFALVSFRVWDQEDGPEFAAAAGPLLDQGARLHGQDDGTWQVTLRDTQEDEAENFARKVLEAAARRSPPLAAGALVVSGSHGATADGLKAAAARGWGPASELPPQVLGLWVHGSQTFDFRPVLPAVPVPAGKPETETEPEPVLG